MKSVKVEQTPLFKRTVKKLKSNITQTLNEEIKVLIKNPEIGELKRGDLAGIRVHKFKVGPFLYLLGYTYKANMITLLSFGSHENYYRDLKNYLK